MRSGNARAGGSMTKPYGHKLAEDVGRYFEVVG